MLRLPAYLRHRMSMDREDAPHSNNNPAFTDGRATLHECEDLKNVLWRFRMTRKQLRD